MKRYFLLALCFCLFIFILPIKSGAEAGSPVADAYFWNATTGEWGKAQTDELGNLMVRTSSNSLILSIINPVTNYMTLSQYNGLYVLISTGNDTVVVRLDTINTELIKHYVLSSTNTATIMAELIKEYVLMSTGADTTVERLDTINTELIKQYLLISTGGDTTVARLDTINIELIKHYVLSSTNTATIMAELIKAYVLTSTGTDGIIARLDGLINGTTVWLTESQLKSLKEDTTTWVTNESFSYTVSDSTYVWKNFYGNGTLTVNFDVKSIGVYSQGGDSTLSWDGGDTGIIWEGVPFYDVPIDETFNNPVVFTYTLSPPATFTMYIRGR